METTSHIEQLKQKLLSLGPILPGSISEQWNVCGTPGCKCKDTVHPKKARPHIISSVSVLGAAVHPCSLKRKMLLKSASG